MSFVRRSPEDFLCRLRRLTHKDDRAGGFRRFWRKSRYRQDFILRRNSLHCAAPCALLRVNLGTVANATTKLMKVAARVVNEEQNFAKIGSDDDALDPAVAVKVVAVDNAGHLSVTVHCVKLV